MDGSQRTSIGITLSWLGAEGYLMFRIATNYNPMSPIEGLTFSGAAIATTAVVGALAYYLPSIVNQIRHRNSYTLATI